MCSKSRALSRGRTWRGHRGRKRMRKGWPATSLPGTAEWLRLEVSRDDLLARGQRATRALGHLPKNSTLLPKYSPFLRIYWAKPHFHRKEICSHQNIHMRADEVFPAGGVLSFGGRRDSMATQDVAHRLVR